MTDRSKTTAPDAHDALPPASTSDPLNGPRANLARAIPRRPRVSWWLGILLAVGFTLLVLPTITAERWLGAIGKIERGTEAPFTVRVPPFAGYDTAVGHTGGGGVLIARGEVPDRDTVGAAQQIEASRPHGPVPYVAFLLLVGVLGGLFTHHTRRSTHGRLLRVQLCSLGLIVVVAIAVKILMLTTALSVLVVPVALFAMVPTLVLDRVVGLAAGTLAALVVSLAVPFDVGVTVMLIVQAGVAGLVIAERPKRLLRATVTAGAAATLFTAATYPLMLYLTSGRLPLDELRDPLHSAWLASALGPALATVLVIPLVPLYQLLVGEITHGKLVELEDLSHPLLKQIANKAPGTWQHSLMMANMAEIAANTIGANGRLVRVGAYFHDLGKSLQPKYFIENLEPGETSPHDKLPPEVSCDAIFAHVTEGIVTARRAGLHERIVDFMHMHHGNGVLEYFWGKTREQGNPKALTVEHFRYPGVPPQSRETAILSICDAVEAASRTLKKPEVQAIDNLVQRIVYGKLHLGQLDESGLSMGDLRRIAESLRDTIRHANHGRIEYPWQKAQQDASASAAQGPGTGQLGLASALTQTGPRLDSLDRPARPDTVAAATKQAAAESADALAVTDDAGVTPNLKPSPRDSSELATKTTAPVTRPGANRDGATTEYPKDDPDDVVELRNTKPRTDDVRAIGPTEPAQLSLNALAASASESASLAPDESDPRMRRVTNPVGDAQRPSAEVIQFATEAKDALDDASKDIAAAPRDAAVESSGGGTMSAARTKAATLPPLKPPTVPPPIGRRSPTMPPTLGVRMPTSASAPPNLTAPPPDGLRPPARPVTGAPNLTAPPPESLRPPAAPQVALPGVTAPPPVHARPPGPNLLDDMTTLRPQYEPHTDLVVERGDDGTVNIAPVKAGDSAQPPAPESDRPGKPHVSDADDALITRPRMLIDPGDTSPSLDLPLRAPPSSPVIATPAGNPDPAWSRGLAARLDAQLDADFGTETPVSAPTRAELQALLDTPPDVTKQQSLAELERLHQQSRDRKSEQDIDFTRRAPYPTREVDEADIEAAIELAPPARRNVAIGVAKKPKKE